MAGDQSGDIFRPEGMDFGKGAAGGHPAVDNRPFAVADGEAAVDDEDEVGQRAVGGIVPGVVHPAFFICPGEGADVVCKRHPQIPQAEDGIQPGDAGAFVVLGAPADDQAVFDGTGKGRVDPPLSGGHDIQMPHQANPLRFPFPLGAVKLAHMVVVVAGGKAMAFPDFQVGVQHLPAVLAVGRDTAWAGDAGEADQAADFVHHLVPVPGNPLVDLLNQLFCNGSHFCISFGFRFPDGIGMERGHERLRPVLSYYLQYTEKRAFCNGLFLSKVYIFGSCIGQKFPLKWELKEIGVWHVEF